MPEATIIWVPPGATYTVLDRTSSPLTASLTVRALLLSRLLARDAENTGGMCWTRKTGTPMSAGSSGIILAKALGPPVDMPIATTCDFSVRLRCRADVGRLTTGGLAEDGVFKAFRPICWRRL